jgi:hypothetical protein
MAQTPGSPRRQMLKLWHAQHDASPDAARRAILAWQAIGLALAGQRAIPTWTHPYLRAVAECLLGFRLHERPTGAQLAPAVAAALFEPEAELARLRFRGASRRLATARTQLERARQPACRATLQRTIQDWHAALATLERDVRPRRTGRATNPFRIDPKTHGVFIALAVWFVLTDKKKTDEPRRPGKRVYEQAARQHAEACEYCNGTPPSWQLVKRDWLRHRGFVESTSR